MSEFILKANEEKKFSLKLIKILNEVFDETHPETKRMGIFAKSLGESFLRRGRETLSVLQTLSPDELESNDIDSIFSIDRYNHLEQQLNIPRERLVGIISGMHIIKLGIETEGYIEELQAYKPPF